MSTESYYPVAPGEQSINNLWGRFVLDPATGLPKLPPQFFWDVDGSRTFSYLRLSRETIVLKDNGRRKPQPERRVVKVFEYPIYQHTSWEKIQEHACYILYKTQIFVDGELL